MQTLMIGIYMPGIDVKFSGMFAPISQRVVHLRCRESIGASHMVGGHGTSLSAGLPEQGDWYFGESKKKCKKMQQKLAWISYVNIGFNQT